MSHFLRFHQDTLVLDIVIEKEVVHSIDLMTCLTPWSALDHIAIVKNQPWTTQEIVNHVTEMLHWLLCPQEGRYAREGITRSELRDLTRLNFEIWARGEWRETGVVR